ncbi:acetate--CoA ligase family protein [Microbaculum sp. FT89]|uniref:acetate--CoA ligase family protein n=1 Tax=Microbaculum sp. FT89 TaxID=3447298 RepID=UPI003F539BC2
MNEATPLAPPTRQTVEDLRAILNPKGVAVIGATDDTSKFGGRALSFLQRHGFAGGIYPVNPRREEVQGLACYPSVAAIGQPVDVALLTVPAAHIAAAIADCGAAGVRGCVVVTSGFAEDGEEGIVRQRELVAAARRARVRLIGPNCLGYINPLRKLALSSSVALAVDTLPAGTIGLVTQSGSVMASMLSHACDEGAGFSTCATVGNQSDIDLCDLIDYFVDDPDTRVVCAYLEGVADGGKLIRSAARCQAAGKPLLIVKAGRTEAGAAITQSHTASLAGSYEVLEAACRRHSAVLMDDPENMLKAAEFLAAYGVPTSDGIAAMTPSGGTAAVVGDRLVAADLKLAEIGTQARAGLQAIFPAGRHINPLDVGGMPGDRMMEAAVRPLELFSAEPDVGTVAVVIATSPALERKAAAWCTVAEQCGKPVIFVVTPGSILNPVRKILRDNGRPYCNTMDQAVSVLRAMTAAAVRVPNEVAVRPAGMGDLSGAANALAPGQLLEPEAKSLLAAAGIPLLGETIAATVDEALRFAGSIDGPVVMKVSSRDIVHKSDIGGVKVGLSGPEAIRAAWNDIAAAVATHAPDASLAGMLVQEMATPALEMIVGARWDRQFGPTVLAGIGGVYVELMHDVAIELAPISQDQALAMLKRLRAWPLLDGARGQPKADVAALTDAMVRLGWLVSDLGGLLSDIEINPLFVHDAGMGFDVVDARGHLETPTTKGRNERSPL